MAYKAPTIVPDNLTGWWGGPDRRVRCMDCGKVVFNTEEDAKRSAEKARERGATAMNHYQDSRCGHWHVGHKRRK